MDVGQRHLYFALQHPQRGVVRCALQLQVNERLWVGQRVAGITEGGGPVSIAAHPQHRMYHQLNTEPHPPRGHGHGIHQERSVVGDDLQYRHRGIPTIAAGVGRERPYQ